MPNLKAPWALAGTVDPCCCPTTECCLYPWPDPDSVFGPPHYPPEDLPESIVLTQNGVPVTLDRILGEEPPYLFRDVTNTFFVYTDSGVELFWRVLTDIISATGPQCLIGSYVDAPGTVIDVTDLFSDTYTATNGADMLMITRTGPGTCVWFGEGINGDGVPWSIQVTYESPPYKFELLQTIDGVSGNLPKADPQSDPTGDYGGVVTVA